MKRKERERESSYFSYAYFPFIGIRTSHLRRCLNFLARPLLLSFWWTMSRLVHTRKKKSKFLTRYVFYSIAPNHLVRILSRIDWAKVSHRYFIIFHYHVSNIAVHFVYFIRLDQREVKRITIYDLKYFTEIQTERLLTRPNPRNLGGVGKRSWGWRESR